MAEVRTNSELADLINTNHVELTRWLGRVEAQVKLTNGRVKELERAKIASDAVEQYKENHKSDKQWDTTTLISMVIALATIAGVLVWIFKQ